MTRDLSAGDPTLLPPLIYALADFEWLMLPLHRRDPDSPIFAAWQNIAALAARYAATCPEIGQDAAQRATLTDEEA